MSESPRQKLLWHSNAPHSPTGYGAQTNLFATRLAEHFDVGISAYYGIEGNIIRVGDIPIYPGIGQTLGNEAILQHARVHFGGADKLREGLVVTLMDVWTLEPAIWSQLNVASWVPVDHQPTPPPVADFFKESGAIPIAMSRFGETELQRSGLDPLYVPHGVDCSVYKPMPKSRCRDKVKMPKDAFIVGMVAANKGNPSRKCFAEAFLAFKALHDKKPDARLYLHTEMLGLFDGTNLPHLLKDVGVPSDAVMFCDQYRAVHSPYSTKRMAEVYNSLDVLLMASAGEGFGIPAVEAQACGVPVIVSDFSAQPELVGAGWVVGGRKTYTPIKSWQFLPDPAEILEALQAAAALSGQKRKQVSKQARLFAEDFHVERVMETYMLPALAEATERFGAPVEPVAAAS